MRRLTPSVYHLDLLRVANVFLFDRGKDGCWLVDCGHLLERLTLLAELWRLGLRPGELRGVVLTHRHSDHAGNARFFQRAGVPVYAHADDAAVLAARKPRLRLSRGVGSLLAGFMCAVENALPARLHVDHTFVDGDLVGGFEVHGAPGHTEGSVLLRDAATACLLTGDTLLTAHPPLTLRGGLCLAYPSYSVDMARSHRELAAFHARDIAYEHLLPGHGRAVVGGAREAVLRFLQS